MRIKYFTLFCLLILSHIGFSQNIQIYKTFGGYRFERDSMSISPKMVLSIMKSNPQAYAEFKTAKTNFDVAGVLGFSGALLIAFPIGTAIGGGDPEWAFAAGGAALLLATIPLNAAFRNHALNALDIYNSDPNSSKSTKASLYWSGLGGKIVLRF